MFASTNKQKRRTFLHSPKAVVLAFVGIVAIAIPVVACGPFFPTMMLNGGTKTLLAAPIGSFEREIKRISPRTPATLRAIPPNNQTDVFTQTAAVDMDDLRHALTALPAAERERLVSAYRLVRAELQRIATEQNADSKVRPAVPNVSIPTGTPAEFAAYLRGAIAFKSNRVNEARKAWSELLQLPAEQRSFRSTWAAFMIGKSWMTESPNDAVVWFRKVRALKEAGFQDSLGLSAASLGWEAKVELDHEHFVTAHEPLCESTGDGRFHGCRITSNGCVEGG